MSKKKYSHLLTKAIFIGAVCNIGETGLSTLLRIILGQDTSLTPDMLDKRLWSGQLIISFLQIAITAFAFYTSWKHLMEYKKRISPNDFAEVAKLKEDASEDTITRLSSYSVGQLIQLWAAVLVGAGIFYNITTLVYRGFIQEVIDLLNMADVASVSGFVSLYNSSHGFKYMGMLIALLLGIFVTGVFLQDKVLKLSSLFITVLFLVSFTALEMNTLTLFSRLMGIVWTSVIFHLLHTIGLLALSAYLAFRYKGL